MYGSTCRMGCDDGFNLLGEENITCEAKPGHFTGYWDEFVPVCKGKQSITFRCISPFQFMSWFEVNSQLLMPLTFTSLSSNSCVMFMNEFVTYISVRRCSSLKAPQFGFIYPHVCTSFPVSGTACYLKCRHGFLGNGGVNLIHCGKDGKWNNDESLILKCLGTQARNTSFLNKLILCINLQSFLEKPQQRLLLKTCFSSIY